jgi:hypothetical protein
MFQVFLTSILSTLKHKDMCMNVLEIKVEILKHSPYFFNLYHASNVETFKI